MEALYLKVDQLNGNELIIRQGEALPPKEPVKIQLSGNIKSVSSYLKVRAEGEPEGLQKVDFNKTVVLVDKKNMTIKLLLDPENYYGTEIMSKLELSDELKTFAINSTTTFKREELVKLIRFNKLFFADPDKHALLLSAYMAFNADVNAKTDQASDTRGNRTNNFVKSVTTNVPTEFILNVPLFKGEPAERFRVEICLDVTDGGARFWFESVELHELIQTRRDAIFEDELSECDGYVIIYQ